MRSVKKFFLAFTVLFTLALCVGCGGGNELVGRYQDNLDPNVVYEFQKGNMLAIETAGDSIATGSTYTIDEEAKRLQMCIRDSSEAFTKLACLNSAGSLSGFPFFKRASPISSSFFRICSVCLEVSVCSITWERFPCFVSLSLMSNAPFSCMLFHCNINPSFY